MAQQAWYKRYEEYRDEALRYMEALRRIERGSLQYDELRSFARYADITLIFESNTIEKAGTKTKGETREIIEKYFPHISASDVISGLEDDILSSTIIQLYSTLDSIPAEKFPDTIILPSITFENASRGAYEVVRHQNALLKAALISVQFSFTKLILENKTLSIDLNNTEKIEYYASMLAEMRQEGIYREHLLFQEDILALHSTIAQELLPNDADVEAGNYRIHDIEIVGVEVKFPSPKLVPQAMAKFIEESNSRVEQVLSGKWDEFIMVAAEVSYNFVRIHPFPDFNGRMSRLLLAMTLRAFGVPFNLALRGSVAKYRNRYFYSLKRANHGDLKPYATLIAMRLVESFREIDENLRLAGQKTLLES